MIIGDDAPMVVGSRHYGVSEADGTQHPSQPFTVLREATFEEWLAEYQSDIAPATVSQWILDRVKHGKYFYEIAID